MEYKDAAEQKMVATFAHHIICALTNAPNGMDFLKKVFLSSVLTPKDVLVQARRTQLRSGHVKAAIYEDIQYALYVEMRDNSNSRVVDSVYESAMQVFSKNRQMQKSYKQYVKNLQKGMDSVFGYGEDASYSMLYFCFLYERIPLGAMAQRSMKQQYTYLLQTRPIDRTDLKMDFLEGCAYGTMPVRESKVYQESKQEVRQTLAEYLKQRYSSEEVTAENMPDFIAKNIHFGIHWDSKKMTQYLDELGYIEEGLFSMLTWIGVDNYHFSHDLLLAVMGDITLGTYGKYINYHPNVDKLIDLAFESYLRPYVGNKHGALTRATLRKEIAPRIIDNIEAFYDRIVTMYYVDCLYKVTEQYRDEYYYNFPWFYDIEKQDTLIEAPVTTEQPNEQRKADDGYAELNAQYERERKRVNEVCKKHAHELAERDRAIAEQTGEIEKLQKQIQIQQEYLNLVNTAEEPDVTETLDISGLYGKRFLFVGKLHESNAKLKQTFPTSTFMETDTANIKSLKVDGVVFLIRNMGHSMYYKVMQSNQFAELPKIYCNSRNINNIYQAMLLGMKG